MGSKRGARPMVSNQEILKTLKEFDIWDEENERIKAKCNPVWDTICQTWNNRMKLTNLYFYVQQNRNNVLEEYKKFKNIVCSRKKLEKSRDVKFQIPTETINVKSDFNDFQWNTHHPFDDRKVKFTIILSSQQWLIIKPDDQLIKSNVEVPYLKPGWTRLFSQLISQQQVLLPCKYSFKYQNILKVNNSEDYLVKISGYCTNRKCKAQIYGVGLVVFKSNESVSFEFFTLNTTGLLHANDARQILLEKHLMQKKYGSVKDTVWESLEYLKSIVEYSSAIKQVGFDKFFLMYWLSEQIDMYNQMLNIGSSICIDATGGVANKIMRSENMSGTNIFLYQINTHINNITLPSGQMLTERQDSRIVQFWLHEWLTAGAQIPLEVITNMSAILQNVITQSFNGMSYKKYLSMCYEYLMDNTQSLPRPFVRIDICQLLQYVARLKSLSSVKSATKDFYFRCIGFMSKATNLEDFETAMKAVFTVSQNNTMRCRKALETLLNQIYKSEFNNSIDYEKLKQQSFCEYGTNNCPEHISCYDEINGSDTVDFIDYNMDNLTVYIDTIAKQTCFKQNSNFSVDSEDVNVYYCPEIVNDLKRLFKQFPAWTSVMLTHFNSKQIIPTSVQSDNYFRCIKETIFKDFVPCRSDTFFINHIESIRTNISKAKAAYRISKQINEEQIDNVKQDVNASNLQGSGHYSTSETSNTKTIDTNVSKPKIIGCRILKEKPSESMKEEEYNNTIILEKGGKSVVTNAEQYIEISRLQEIKHSTPEMLIGSQLLQVSDDIFSIVLDEESSELSEMEVECTYSNGNRLNQKRKLSDEFDSNTRAKQVKKKS